METAEAINLLGEFRGKRDIPQLTRAALRARGSGPHAQLNG